MLPTTMSVEIACRAHPLVFPIDEIVRLIDAFADPGASWTVPRACERVSSGLLRLLRRIAALEPADMNPFLKHQNFTRALVHVVRRGDREVVEWLVNEYLSTGKIREPVNEAAVCGRLEILQWLQRNHSSRVVWTLEETELAARHNHLETAQWLYSSVERPQRFHSVYGDVNIMRQALLYSGANGNLEMAKWVYEERRAKSSISLPKGYIELALASAASNGDRAFVEGMRELFDCSYHHRCMASAIRGQHLELAQWLHGQTGFVRVSVQCLKNAAANGQIELISWVLDNLELIDRKQIGVVIESAAEGGHLEIIQLLHDNCGGEWWSSHAFDAAAEHGHLAVVEWLNANRIEGCSSYAMDRAAKNGHLHVVQWLHANRTEGCSTQAMDWAAARGHLRMVQWLDSNRSEGCSTDAMDKAAANGHLDVVMWLHDYRSEGCTIRAMDEAAANGHLHVMKWLHVYRAAGCSSAAFCEALRHSHVDVVQWLFANKPEQFSSEAMESAMEGGNFELVLTAAAYARNRFEPDTSWFRGAIRGQHCEVLDWLDLEYLDSTPNLGNWLEIRGRRLSRNSLYIHFAVNRIEERLRARWRELRDAE